MSDPLARTFTPPYVDVTDDYKRTRLRQDRMRAILDAGDYAIETNRHVLITFLHEFLEVDEKDFNATMTEEATPRRPAIPFAAIGRRVPGGRLMATKPTQLPPEAADVVGGRDEHPVNKRNIADDKSEQSSGSEKKQRDTSKDADD